MTGAPLSAAIVGSGPAGLFTLDAILRHAPDARVDVFERLPTPFGLVRSGIAPDHQGTKAVVRQFERAFARPSVRLLANVEVGRDVALERLIETYDLVFAATGSPQDRKLGIPGEDLQGVHGSQAFIGWLNGHPDHRDLAPRVGENVVIVGAGNVAIDVARILAKSAEELRASDLCSHAWPIVGRARRIDVVARGDMARAKFDLAELEALGKLAQARPALDPENLARARWPDHSLGATFEGFASLPRNRPTTIAFHFGLTPVALLGDGRIGAVRFIDSQGGVRELEADTVVTAIGAQVPAAPWPPGVIAVGWAAGSAGSIPASRKEAAEAVARAMAAVPRPHSEPGQWSPAPGAAAVIDWAGWKRVEAAELARAEPPRPREKFTRRAELLAAASNIR